MDQKLFVEMQTNERLCNIRFFLEKILMEEWVEYEYLLYAVDNVFDETVGEDDFPENISTEEAYDYFKFINQREKMKIGILEAICIEKEIDIQQEFRRAIEQYHCDSEFE